jgi:hypothetical protein
MTIIEELEQQVHHLENELHAVRCKLRQAKLDECPVKPGDIVRYKDGDEYRVVRIDNIEWLWVFANPKKKDGSWSRAERRLYGDIEVVVPA